MVELNKSFSINDVVIDRNVEDKDFAVMEIYALGSGNNSHFNPISKEVLSAKENIDSFKGKFIIGKYDKLTKDVRSHEIQEDIYGYVSVIDEPQIKSKVVDGEEKDFVVVKAYISKIYAKEIVDMFKLDNKRSVSCEFTCSLQYEEDAYGRPIIDGQPMDVDNPILAYSISGITLLSKKVKPSVKGADAIMKRFSEDTNKLENKSKGDNMEDIKELSEQPKDEDIVMAEENEDTKEFPKDKEDDEKEMSCEGTEEMAEEKQEDDEPAEDNTEEMSCEGTEEMACGETEEMSEQENTEEMAEEEPQEEENEKTFCEQAIEFADEDHKEFVEKLFSSELKDMVEQIIQLKTFMDATIKTNTEKRFSEIMVEPKLCLSEKAYNVLFEEGAILSLDELDAFEQKVKAFCEDVPRKQNESDDELLKFACDDTQKQHMNNSDVWSRIENN